MTVTTAFLSRITLCGGTAETDIAALAPKALARRVSFLPQQRAVPDITAKTLVSHGRYPYLGFSRTLSDKDRTVIQNALKTAGVSAFADRGLPMLSGGERQRVFLAMLLAQNTEAVRRPARSAQYPGIPCPPKSA